MDNKEKYTIQQRIDDSKLVNKIVKNYKNKTIMEPGIVYAPWVVVAGKIGEINGKYSRLLKVKDWLKEKRKKRTFDVEEELTKMLTESIAEEMKKQAENFSPKEIISSRYATKKVNNKFYGTIKFGS